MQAEPWAGFWHHLQLSLITFADVGLVPSDSDKVIWQRCQDHRVLLLTNNRNDDGADSLESTIRACNMSDSLPVFTIGDAERLQNDREYRERVIWSLLEYLLEIDNLRGSGRLFLPGKE